jgi:hypothetical protein
VRIEDAGMPWRYFRRQFQSGGVINVDTSAPVVVLLQQLKAVRLHVEIDLTSPTDITALHSPPGQDMARLARHRHDKQRM